MSLMHLIRNAAICSTVVMMASAGAAASAPTFSEYFDAACQGDGIVGAGYVLVRDGRIVGHHEFGFADREQGMPVTPQTIFHYGSITKTLTAISIMELRNQGRLSLDDHITQYIPELRLVHDAYGSMDNVTLRMLMSHSAGFQNPTWPYKQGKPWEPFEPTTWNQLIAMMPYQELLFEPGSRYS
jgi:CubicO group peptidase (beta-lactamase class C family)